MFAHVNGYAGGSGTRLAINVFKLQFVSNEHYAQPIQLIFYVQLFYISCANNDGVLMRGQYEFSRVNVCEKLSDFVIRNNENLQTPY